MGKHHTLEDSKFSSQSWKPECLTLNISSTETCFILCWCGGSTCCEVLLGLTGVDGSSVIRNIFFRSSVPDSSPIYNPKNNFAHKAALVTAYITERQQLVTYRQLILSSHCNRCVYVCVLMHVTVHTSLLSCNCRFRNMYMRFKDRSGLVSLAMTLHVLVGGYKCSGRTCCFNFLSTITDFQTKLKFCL